MATSLSSLLGGIYTGPSGFSGYSGAGQSGFSGYSGTSGYSGPSGFSGYSGRSGYSGISGYSGTTFTGGTVTGAVNITNTTTATSVGSGALIVAGGAGFSQPVYVSGNLFIDGQTVLPADTHVLVNDVSISTSTLANLSGFSFVLGDVGATYGFQFFIIYSSVNTGAGLGVYLTAPGFAEFASRALLSTSASGTAGSFSGNSYLDTTAAPNVKVQAVSSQVVSVSGPFTRMMGTFQGTILVSTAGTLQLQVSNSLNSTTTSQVTVRRGSTGWVWRIR